MLDDAVNKYSNTVNKTIKMKPIDVTDDSYAEHNEDFNKKDPKFKVRDHAKISKYKNIFSKGYTPNWPEKVLKRKGDKFYVKWKGHNNRFNSWVDKKDLE